MTKQEIRDQLELIEEQYEKLRKLINVSQDRYNLPLIDFQDLKITFTEEELQQEITLDRINDYHTRVGEDFCDQNETVADYRLFSGYILHKFRTWNKEIIEILNKKYGGFNDINHLYEDKGLTEDDFYSDFAAYCNLTEKTKARVNEILIETEEYDN